MAVIIGNTGDVTFANGYVVNVKSWALNVAVDEHDMTDFGSSVWAEYMGGFKRWSGSYECWYDDTTHLPVVNDGVDDAWDAVSGSATFKASEIAGPDVRSFVGTIIITANDVSVNPADPNVVVVNFRGDGALTIN